MALRKVFNILGSPDSDMLASLSLNYMYQITALESNKYKFYYAVLHPNGKVSFIQKPDEKSFTNSRKDTQDFGALLSRIKEVCPEVIIYHVFGTKGCTIYRSALEILDIPILGSTSEKQFITTNKALTRSILHAADVAVAPGVELYDRKIDQNLLIADLERKLGYPLVVKAATVENSEGVFIAKNRKEVLECIPQCFTLSPEAVVIEKFIAGREIRSAVIQDENEDMLCLPVLEYMVGGDDSIRSLEKKLDTEDYEKSGMMKPRNHESTQHFLHEDKDSKLIKNVRELSFKAFSVLQLRDFAVFDMRVDQSGKPYILEANLFCCFNAGSKVNYLAKKVDISDEKLLEMTINNALRRHSK